MTRSLIYSLSFHVVMILLTILSLPFMIRQPIDLPPILSVEFIQISDKTNIPFAPKARKVLEKVKEVIGDNKYRKALTIGCSVGRMPLELGKYFD